ncbi:ABC transporter permease subunit [Methanolobus sp.]|jgi:ABC-type transport system involved in multi-copper enzyme maturation permease subunit|uniref:ABC transporter permease n=1 Tax=Methanolobus sp. TaxID=1874737 RepID=UPI0025CF3FCD|nr:ABC transporter permease subunit [Methanolobus sp.]
MLSFSIAKNEIRHLLRERTFFLILSVFILITLASTYIGWSSQHTIESVYQESAILLTAAGQNVPPSPFSNLPTLDIVKNMIIYIVLIGSLLAITVGHSIGTKDQKAGVVRILFSKPVTKKDVLIGKVTSLMLVLFAIMIVSLGISIASIAMLSEIHSAMFLQLIGFYGISFLYILGFGLLGLAFGLMKRESATALLIPVIIWIVITFALPEMGSALYPTSSLNPILPQTNILDSPVLSTIHNILYPFSISEHYKLLSSAILALQGTESVVSVTYSPIMNMFILTIWLILTLAVSIYAMSKFDISRGDVYE